MSWSKDSLLAKARILFDKAFLEDRDDIFFGLLNAIALELLERAAIANISPTLLADNDEHQRNILYALGNPKGNPLPKSIATARVISLCEELIDDFDKKCRNICFSMANRRNAEAHSGEMAFIEFGSDQWLGDLFYVCNILSKSLNISLSDLFNDKIAEEAKMIITANEDNIKNKVMKEIEQRRNIFKSDSENNPHIIEQKIEENLKNIDLLSHEGYHKERCPSCGNFGLVSGKESGETKRYIDNNIEVLKNIISTGFQCNVCGLKLKLYQELKIASLPLHYTRRLKYTPEEYFGYEEMADSEDEGDPWMDYSNE